eukprot:2977629-Rhodomonas_salina.1
MCGPRFRPPSCDPHHALLSQYSQDLKKNATAVSLVQNVPETPLIPPPSSWGATCGTAAP